VLLRRRAGSEEVLVSALLAPLRFVDQDPLPRAALMKVFVSKPGATPVLHFDCRASWVGDEEERGAADYAINAVRYHSAPGAAGEDEYEGPEFRWCSYALLVFYVVF
jgi:complement component 1 Q subcomponent-binding protein